MADAETEAPCPCGALATLAAARTLLWTCRHNDITRTRTTATVMCTDPARDADHDRLFMARLFDSVYADYSTCPDTRFMASSYSIGKDLAEAFALAMADQERLETAIIDAGAEPLQP